MRSEPPSDQMTKTTAERGSFAGHETFPLRYSWLPKAVQEATKDDEVFGREDAIVRLGVGKNMVRAIRHWGLACGVLTESGRGKGGAVGVSGLGSKLFGEGGWDPYLEDPATLWVAHWELARRQDRATTWFWAFNLARTPEFTKAGLVEALDRYARGMQWRTASQSTLERDVEVFVRTYVPAHLPRGGAAEDTLDSPLVELGLVSETGPHGSYAVQRGEQLGLPDDVFAYATAAFINASVGSARTLPLRELLSVGAPGLVFALTEDALLDRARRLSESTGGAVVYEETSSLQQLYIKEPLEPLRMLNRYYRGRGRTGES
jgi:hypothetical protein